MHNFEVLKQAASLRKADSFQAIEKWTLEMELQCSLDRTIPIWRDSCSVGRPLQTPLGAQKQHRFCCLTLQW